MKSTVNTQHMYLYIGRDDRINAGVESETSYYLHMTY
jgi:hypothetical protein